METYIVLGKFLCSSFTATIHNSQSALEADSSANLSLLPQRLMV